MSRRRQLLHGGRKGVLHPGTLEPTNGVYIQDTDGYFHTSDEWDGTFVPNGVAVITDACRFVIALEHKYFSSSAGYVNGVVSTGNSVVAATDYAGEANTTAIIDSAWSIYNTPVEYCRGYVFPNGAIGYLGAAGEWQAAVDNKSAIEAALSKCGGLGINTIYWTSTMYSYGSTKLRWCMYWYDNMLSHQNYNSSNKFARPFAAI